MNNPYQDIYNIMTGAANARNVPEMTIGTVINPPPTLTVSYNGMTLTNNEIYIADYLLGGYTRHMVGATSNKGGGSGDAAYESHNHPIDNDETWTDTLKAGDKVAIMPATDESGTNQIYFILARLFRPDWRAV